MEYKRKVKNDIYNEKFAKEGWTNCTEYVKIGN